jgi:glutathione S-transferase
MTMTLYHAPGTRSLRVLWALRELGLPHAVVERSLFDFVADRGWRDLNATGRVPFLVDGELRLAESLAILHHLFEVHAPASPLWREVGHPERSALLQWLHYSETVQVHLQSLNQQLHFIRPPEARSAATVKLEIARLKRSLDAVEQGLGEREHLLGSGFSAADLAMGYTVAVSQVFRPLEGQPRLAAYVRRLQARPAAAGLLDFPAVAAPVSV